MNSKCFLVGFITGLLLLMITSVIIYNTYTVPPDLTLSQIEVEDLYGQKVSLNSYKGKPLVVNYWGTWCAPCLKEFPHFEEIKKNMEGNVNFVMISDESMEKITKFKESNDYSFNYLHSKTKLVKYGITSYPSTYFYNSKGQLVNKHTSLLTVSKLKNLINDIE